VFGFFFFLPLTFIFRLENRNVILDFNYDNDNVNCCPAGNGWLVGVLPVKLNGHGEQFHIGEGGKLLFV
jgi:hypothetical protein